MQYEYFKSRPLNEDEKRRLRISVGAGLRLSGAIQHPCKSRIANQLVAFINKPNDMARNELLSWLLSYGSPMLLGNLIGSLARHKTRRRELEVIRRADVDQILPREYITPDFQKIQISAQPQSALVCFTGNAFKMNMPLQLFHCLTAGQFDLIFYLRDAEKQHFTQGIKGLASSMDGLIAELQRQIPPACHIAAISTSSGGYAAARFAEAAGVRRLAMFSPPLKFKDIPAVSGPAQIQPDDTRIFFARTHEKDIRFAADWNGTGYSTSIKWFNTNSHGTLKYLFKMDEMQALIDWLRGGKDTIPYGKLGMRRSEALMGAVSRLFRFDFRN